MKLLGRSVRYEYQYLHVRHFLKKEVLQTSHVFCNLTMLEQWLELKGMKGAWSKIYQMLLRQEKVEHWSQKAWEVDIGLQFTEEQGRLINVLGHKVSCNITLREYYYKTLHRWYEKLSKMFPVGSSKCWKGGEQSNIQTYMVGLHES